MRKKLDKYFATGLDTPIMLLVIASISFSLMFFFAPYFFVSDLKYMRKISLFNLLQVDDHIIYIAKNLLLDSFDSFSYNQNLIFMMSILSKVFIGISTILIIVFVILIYKNKQKAQKISLLVFLFSVLPAICAIIIVYYINIRVNNCLGIENNFFNLTVFAKIQNTSTPFIQILLSIFIIIFSKKILLFENNKNSYTYKKFKENKKLGKRTKITFILVFLLVPVIIAFGVIFLKNRSYYFISLCVIVISMAPFFVMFEDRKPQAREIVVIAVMVVIATMGRMAFSMLPNFKPVTAIVIISGIGLGAEAGFLTGALTAFASNFFFGQGPWTPWQMFAFGIIGFLSGLLFRNNRKKYAFNKVILCIYGGFVTFAIYGFIMDTSSALSFLDGLTWEVFVAKYISGVPVNFTHAVSTMIFLFAMTKPILKKLDRVKLKYGILS